MRICWIQFTACLETGKLVGKVVLKQKISKFDMVFTKEDVLRLLLGRFDKKEIRDLLRFSSTHVSRSGRDSFELHITPSEKEIDIWILDLLNPENNNKFTFTKQEIREGKLKDERMDTD